MKKNNHYLSGATIALTLVTMLFTGLHGESVHASYYPEGEENVPIFRPFPKDSGRGSDNWRVRYFGPVGIGINLKRPGMTMEIANVEEGSPADQTGKLKQGQIIESINGVILKDIDPRIILGDIITKAEATDGKINLKIKGEGDVLVEIPVMGSYSETWPVNCEKSDKIVRNLADLIGKQGQLSWGSVLFLLSTGEDKDLDVVKKWMNGIETIGGMNWEKGYKGLGLCEYYLRTGDQSVLPVIKKMTEELKENMYLGGWSGRGKPARFTYSTGTGQVHASGMHCLTFILMARLCGVEVDEYMLNESLTQFYRFGGHGNVAYGNGPPEGGYRDNGKTSGLAVAMAVAAQLTPEGENSVYANARDNSAMKAFYATNWFHAAHTGGGMGEIWHHGAVALMREKRPTPYRSYHDTRRWVMELSRRHDGSIGIAGMDDRYNRSLTDATAGRAWGTYFALTYTYPRKALQIWGAPRSQYAKAYQLPERPWGNAADDIFNSPYPINPDGSLGVAMNRVAKESMALGGSDSFQMNESDKGSSHRRVTTGVKLASYNPVQADRNQYATLAGYSTETGLTESPGMLQTEMTLKEKMEAILNGKAEPDPPEPEKVEEEETAEANDPSASQANPEPVTEPVVEPVPEPAPQPVVSKPARQPVTRSSMGMSSRSFEPVQIGGELTMDDLLNEKVETDASVGVINYFSNTNLTEQEVFKFILHPEYANRAGAMNQVVQRGWDHMVLPLLKAEDPRLRHAGLLAITGMFKGGSLSENQLTDEMFDEVGKMIEDPNESWWVTLYAVKALNRADPDRIAEHRDRLMEILKYDSVWIQSDAIKTLCKIATDSDHYKEVLPVIIDKAAALRTDSSSWNASQAIKGVIQSASSKVKDFATPLLQKTYADLPPQLADPYTGAVMLDGARTMRSRIGSIIEQLPDGEEFVRRTPKTTLESYISGEESDMYLYSGKFTPKDELIGTWAWAVHPTPEGPDDIDSKIKAWLEHKNREGQNLTQMKNIKDTLVLEDGGKVSKSGYYKGFFWSGNMLISNNEGAARKMELRKKDGYDFLVIEREFGRSDTDDGTEAIPADYHPGFMVYLRQEETE